MQNCITVLKTQGPYATIDRSLYQRVMSAQHRGYDVPTVPQDTTWGGLESFISHLRTELQVFDPLAGKLLLSQALMERK